MKKIYPILLFSLSVMALLSVYSFAVGYATHNNGGITTAPGDLDISAGVKATCAKCHTGNAFQSSTEVFVTDANNHNILGYDPNATYKIHVKINHQTGTPAGYGFQMVGLIDATASPSSIGLQNYPGWSSNVKEVAGILGRRYYEHNGVSTSNEFTIDWKAPAEGTGSVTFYAVGNAVNKNGVQSGDSPSNTTFQLTEGLLLQNESPIAVSNFRVLGNPSVDAIRFSLSAPSSSEATIGLYDLTGQQMIHSKEPLFSGTNIISLDAQSVQAGTYILTVQTKTGQIAKKVLLMH